MNAEFINSIGDFILMTFEPLKMLENVPNYLFIGTGFLLLGYWLKSQADFNKEAADKGTLK